MHDLCFLDSTAWLLSWMLPWRTNISENVQFPQLLVRTLCKIVAFGAWRYFYNHPRDWRWPVLPYFITFHSCNSVTFSLLTHTVSLNYFAAVKDVVTNCLNTNGVSKQISAASESFGKYREWQCWLSIWAQLFSSLVGSQKHKSMMKDAHTHSHTAVSGLGVQWKWFKFFSEYMLGMKLQCANMAWHKNPGLEMGYISQVVQILYCLKCYWIDVSADETRLSLTAAEAPQMVKRNYEIMPRTIQIIIAWKRLLDLRIVVGM